MSGFKLIAITPLAGCSKDFCKNLKPGIVYQFYRNYKISLDEEGTRIKSVIPQLSKVPEDLYALENGIHLNISAVVGKNGSGKSTLFELLFYMIWIIATEKKNLGVEIKLLSQKLRGEIDELSADLALIEKVVSYSEVENVKVPGINENALLSAGYKSISGYLFSLIRKHNLKIDNVIQNKDIEIAIKVRTEIEFQIKRRGILAEQEEGKEGYIRDNLSLSVIYSDGDQISGIEYINGAYAQTEYWPKQGNIVSSLVDFNLENFFYSIAINYSHHSLNSTTIGNWINQLFHKNDGYITPLVINPMRNEGDFKINRELRLSKSRLLANELYYSLREEKYKLLEKYEIGKFIYRPKEFIGYPIAYGTPLSRDSTLNNLLLDTLDTNVIEEKIDFWEFAIAYLDNKIKRIDENYSFLIYRNKSSDDPLYDFIKDDKSHITQKVRQTLNFLKLTQRKENRSFWTSKNMQNFIELDLKVLKGWLQLSNPEYKKLNPYELLEYALPGCFTIDFEFKTILDQKVEPEKLSSGEQQMIFNVNSIMYHLYNIQSIHSRTEKERPKYKNINIVLDEIELYYHPEMQRQLVKNLKDSLENLKTIGEGGITSINICFLTHSPFVLSDIPNENVLRLPNDEKQNNSYEESFGANIHDLLATSFFLKKGFNGDFAKEYIMELIDEIKNYVPEKLKTEYYQNLKTKIGIIGEPFLRVKLQEMLDGKNDTANTN